MRENFTALSNSLFNTSKFEDLFRACALLSLACSAGVFFGRGNVLHAKAPCWNSKREEKIGRVNRSGVGAGERRENAILISPLPPPPVLLSPQHLPWGLLFLLSLIFPRHNIKDGGYNSTNVNKQLSPAQNTPALQAISSPATFLTGNHVYKSDLTRSLLRLRQQEIWVWDYSSF